MPPASGAEPRLNPRRQPTFVNAWVRPARPAAPAAGHVPPPLLTAGPSSPLPRTPPSRWTTSSCCCPARPRRTRRRCAPEPPQPPARIRPRHTRTQPRRRPTVAATAPLPPDMDHDHQAQRRRLPGDVGAAADGLPPPPPAAAGPAEGGEGGRGRRGSAQERAGGSRTVAAGRTFHSQRGGQRSGRFKSCGRMHSAPVPPSYLDLCVLRD
jgi:hypothetical protein